MTKGIKTNGTFTIDKTIAKQNELIKIAPTPAEGYRLKSGKVSGEE